MKFGMVGHITTSHRNIRIVEVVSVRSSIKHLYRYIRFYSSMLIWGFLREEGMYKAPGLTIV